MVSLQVLTTHAHTDLKVLNILYLYLIAILVLSIYLFHYFFS